MPTHLRALVALVALAATIAAACTAAPASLSGRQFLSVDVAGAPRPLVAGTRIRLEFGPTDLGASAGCNHIGGTYRIDGNRLVFDGAGMTEMGCDPERHAQDDWLVEFLGSRPTVRLVVNDLFLESGSTVVRLLDREVAEPDLNIVGPTWTVESIITGDAVASVPDGLAATLVFKADGTVEVNPGCNRGSGTWKLEGGGIRISEIGLTKMACDGPAGALEASVLRVLDAGTLVASIDASSLTLQAGNDGLQLRGS